MKEKSPRGVVDEMGELSVKVVSMVCGERCGDEGIIGELDSCVTMQSSGYHSICAFDSSLLE